jgi:hypothetical protein
MAEGVDGEERHLAEVALSLLQQYTSMLVDLLLSTSDFIRQHTAVRLTQVV